MILQIKRLEDEFEIKEITKEQSKTQKGKITKYNFIISSKQPEDLDRLMLIIKDVPYKGKNRKLITLINELYKTFEMKYPNWCNLNSIPLQIVNERYALVVTKDFIKCVTANNQKSSRSRVHIDYYTNLDFFRDIPNGIICYKENPSLFKHWEDKVHSIYDEQLKKLSK